MKTKQKKLNQINKIANKNYKIMKIMNKMT